MPRTSNLKVFRTPIGFHDAYVAAPSQKAALKAWGSDADLFARGVAERVDDPDLTREPLEHPGKVIRRSRGSMSEQLAALPKSPSSPSKRLKPVVAEPPPRTPARRQSIKPPIAPKPTKPAKPRPDVTKLRAAEQALEEAEARHNQGREALARRQADLDRERRVLEKQQNAERTKLERKLNKAQSAYDRAMRAWRS